jgi:helicase
MKTGLPADHGLSKEILAIQELVPVSEGLPLLTDVQFDALAQGVARGESAIVSAPTSTGKTLIGLWTIAAAVQLGKRAVYLVSHRALARQKFDEIRLTLAQSLLDGDLASLVIATGDGVEDAAGRKVAHPLEGRIVVATYEKFLYSLAVSGPPRNLSDTCVVCDEIQLIGDASRGCDVELLLTLLRRAKWHQLICLSAVLSPRDAEELGEWLDVRVIRNPLREKTLRIECRHPSGTLEVVAKAGGEVSIMEETDKRRSRETMAIVEELVSKETRRPVIVFCMRLDDTYGLSSQWVQQYKGQRSTVAGPAGVEIEANLLNALACRSAYHNAELAEEEREIVESRLTAGQIDVVFATATLAAGVNYPLGSAVFDRWKRYNFNTGSQQPISRPEFQNMAGRVGRMGQVATEGLAVLKAEGNADTQLASHLMELDAQDELVSRIAPGDFNRLLLHIFSGKLCDRRTDAYDILAQTLSASREIKRNRAGLKGWNERLNAEVDALIAQECLVEANGTITPTLYGVAVARTGLKPLTASWLISQIFADPNYFRSHLPNADSVGSEDDLAFILAHAALTSPEFGAEGGRQTRYMHWRLGNQGLVRNPWAARLGDRLFVRPWHANPSAANGALLLASWASGQPRPTVDGLVAGVRLGTIQTLARDASWVISGISEIIRRITAPSLDEHAIPTPLRGDRERLAAMRLLSRGLARQALRIGQGLPADVLWMSGIEQAGSRSRLTRTEILSLRALGITTPLQLMRGDEEADKERRRALADANTKDGGASARLRDATKAWKVKHREHSRKIQERRTKLFDSGALVRDLYTLRGDKLETALEQAFGSFKFGFKKLDTKGTQGRPDYLLEIDTLAPIVVEVKTREADDNVVGLNAATEVLAASELMGRKSDFCLTICSPAIDPSVPGLVENCGRLCVVDVSDLTDAFVKLLHGELTPLDFHNWLTTPGIALMNDLDSGG